MNQTGKIVVFFIIGACFLMLNRGLAAEVQKHRVDYFFGVKQDPGLTQLKNTLGLSIKIPALGAESGLFLPWVEGVSPGYFSESFMEQRRGLGPLYLKWAFVPQPWFGVKRLLGYQDFRIHLNHEGWEPELFTALSWFPEKSRWTWGGDGGLRWSRQFGYLPRFTPYLLYWLNLNHAAQTQVSYERRFYEKWMRPRIELGWLWIPSSRWKVNPLLSIATESRFFAKLYVGMNFSCSF